MVSFLRRRSPSQALCARPVAGSRTSIEYRPLTPGDAMTPQEWTPTLFASIDAKDTSRFLSFLSDDASFRFANLPAAVGQDAIRKAVDGFLASIAGCRHDVSNVWALAGTVICEGRVTYTRL